MNQLLKLFTEEQFAQEIHDNLSNTDIDKYLDYGCRLLHEAEECLKDESYLKVGKTRAQVVLDIARIKYNLDQFQKAFFMKEKAEVLTCYGNPMFFHAN
jgi:hypothetical protein